MMLRGVPSLASSIHLTAPAVGAYLAGAAALAGANTLLSLRAIKRGSPMSSAAMRRHHAVLILTQLWLLGGLAALMLLGYTWWVMKDLHLEVVPLAGELAILAPFFAGVLLVWILDYPFHRAVRLHVLAAQARRRSWTLWEYLAYNTRHQLLFVAVPVSLIILIMHSLMLLVGYLLPAGLADYVLAAAMLLALGAVFLLTPLLIVRIWKTQRLSEGQLRSELEQMCRRFKLKYRDILIWQSGGIIANAGVMGLIGRLRFILLSDGLLEEMDLPDIRAIFAHEAAHIVHHHIFYAALFAVGTVGLCGSAVELLSEAVELQTWEESTLLLALLSAAWGAGFGYVSRRFERQSDVNAAWALGRRDGGDDPDRITHEGAAIFAHALQRVGEINGIPARQRNWRHGSIEHRVRHILQLGGTAGTRRQDDRLVRRLKMGLWALAAGAVVLAAAALIMPD